MRNTFDESGRTMMDESQPVEDEDGNTPPSNPGLGGSPGTGNGEGQGTSPPNGNNEADATTVPGAVAGRGPGSTMEFQSRRVALTRGLTALRHRDFRLFWLSQLISLIGTWMQILGQGWLVLELGGSALDLGTVSALQFLPTLVLSLFGGLLADQFPKRTLLLITQGLSMILALVLASLTWLGMVSIPDVMILAVILGLVSAVDMPVRQAYVVELVGISDVPNAVALNSAVFNAARLAGPAIAGLLIGWLGLAPVFFLNGISFLPVLAALLAMRAGSTAVVGGIRSGAILTHVREGLSYVRHTPVVRETVVLVALVATFGMNFSVIVPVFAHDTLDVGADGFGVLMSAMGLGSLVASLFLAFLDWKPHPNLLVAGAAVFGFLEVVLSRTADFFAAAILLGAIGFAMIFLTTIANTTLQTSIPNRLRGRVMSVYTTVFVGTTPLGSLFAGSLASLGGVPMPLLAGGVISIATALFVWWRIMQSGVGSPQDATH